MSNIKLVHSGGNSVSITAPDSNPASNRTLKLPSDADGTIITTGSPAPAATGTIIQVLHTTTSTDANATDHNTWVDSGLTQNITMSSASNKVLITAHLYAYLSCSGANEIGAYARLLRGSTALGSSSGLSAFFPINTAGSDDAQAQIPFQFYDTPGAGTHTYKVQGKPYNAATTVTMQGGGTMFSTLTLMEVVA